MSGQLFTITYIPNNHIFPDQSLDFKALTNSELIPIIFNFFTYVTMFSI